MERAMSFELDFSLRAAAKPKCNGCSVRDAGWWKFTFKTICQKKFITINYLLTILYSAINKALKDHPALHGSSAALEEQ